MKYEEQLQKAIDYALENGSFSKINLAESADIVCAYGLGRYFGEAFSQWGFREKMHVNTLCDSDMAKWGKTFEGLQCISPEELFSLSRNKNVLVIPFVGNPVEVNKMLRENNISYVNASDCIFEMICDMNRSKEWFRKNNMSEVLGWLEDEESKRVYTSVICNRIAPQFSQFDYDQLYSPGEYFETDAFHMDQNECFVDCGAYNGDTVERMLNCAGGAEKIYAFEMDKGNYADLQQNVREIMKRYRLRPENVRLINAGVWNVNERLPYGKEEFGSKESFCLFKGETIGYTELVKIDDVLGGKRVTFIKMDIEGAERNALEGAKEVIVENKPKMAICLYHRLQDFWEIPTYLKSLVPQYRLYVRHHQNGSFGGTVLYAVR